MSVIVQFVTDAGVGAAIIRYFTWSEFSHCDILLPGGNLLGARDSRIGTVPAGVEVRPPGYRKFTKVLRATLPCTPEQAQLLYAAAKSQLGKSYDMEAILDFGLHDADLPPSAYSKSWICSELVAWSALKAGVPIINPKVNYQKISPGDLLKSPALRY